MTGVVHALYRQVGNVLAHAMSHQFGSTDHVLASGEHEHWLL